MISIEYDGKRGRVLPGAYISAVSRICSQMPARRMWKDRTLYFEDLASNWLFLDKELQFAAWSEEAKARLLEARGGEETKARYLREITGAVPDVDYDFKRDPEPWEHQRRAIAVTGSRTEVALIMDPGTGKTRVGIDTALYQWRLGMIANALVLAPSGVHKQWVREQLPNFVPPWASVSALALSMDMRKKDKARLERILSSDPKKTLRFFTLNLEALAFPRGQEMAARIIKSGPTLLIVDESSRIGNHRARRTKAIIKLGRMATSRRILTGTPVTKGLENLHSQYQFLSSDIFGHTSFFGFKQKYCQLGGFANKQIIGYRNLEELQSRIAPYTFRIKKEDCLDLPPKLYKVREVPLSLEQKRLYLEMRDNLLVHLESGHIVPALAGGVVMLRLQQIVCGYLPALDPETGRVTGYHFIKDVPRIPITAGIIEDTDEHVLVWCRFRPDIARLAKEFSRRGISFVEYHGGVSTADREKAETAFKAGKVQVFLGQTETGGIGLNLQRASQVIYYSNSARAESRWQSEDRAHRGGQTRTVLVTDLISRGTVDVRLRRILLNNEKVAALPFADIRAMLTDPVEEIDE